jgi:hypothetical protein
MQSELVNPEAVATLGKNDMDDDKQTQKYNMTQKTKKMNNTQVLA